MSNDHPGKPGRTTAAAIGRAAGAAAAAAVTGGPAAATEAAAVEVATGGIHEDQQINTQTAGPATALTPQEKAAWRQWEEASNAIQNWVTAALVGAALEAWRGLITKDFVDAARGAFISTGHQQSVELLSKLAESPARIWAKPAETAAEAETAEEIAEANWAAAARAAGENAVAAARSVAQHAASPGALTEAEADIWEAAVEEQIITETSVELATAEEIAGVSGVVGLPAVLTAVAVISIALALNYLFGEYCHGKADDPPDPAFRDIYQPRRYEFPQVTPSGTMSRPLAMALDAALRSQLESLSLCMAELVSLERYQGAMAAGDDEAAGRQLTARVNYAVEAAQALARAARALDDLAVARRTSGQPDVMITADQVRVAQERLGSEGLTGELRAVFDWLGLATESLTDELRSAALNLEPDKVAGTYEEKLLAQAELYRAVSTALSGSAPRDFSVGNPHDREETIEIFVWPVSMPPGWRVAIGNAKQAGTEFPVREIEAGKRYAVTLPAHRQVTLTTMLAPHGEVGARTTTRWAVEGRIGDELIGGIVHEMIVP